MVTLLQIILIAFKDERLTAGWMREQVLKRAVGC